MNQRSVRLTAAVIAGFVAIIINSALLYFGSALGIETGHGGLLKLIAKIVGVYPIPWGRGDLRGVPPIAGKYGFHFLVGILMAMFYAYVVDPSLGVTRSPLIKGLIYALIVWLANALVILPLLGYGIAGYHEIPMFGVLYYAFAHTVFFVLVAVLYSQITLRTCDKNGATLYGKVK